MGRGRKIGTLENVDGADNPMEREDATATVQNAETPMAEPSGEQTDIVSAQPEAPAAPAPVTAPAAPKTPEASLKDATFLTKEQKEMILQENLSKILCAPKVKGALPTIVRFKEKDSIGLRTVIIDIGAPVLYDAWKYYKANADHPSAEAFLQYVYTLTKSRIPRLYKVVAELRLD